MMSRRAIRVGGRRLPALARAAFCLALLVALLARGVIPAGFMLAPDARNGEVTVAMCSGMGAVQTLPVPGSGTAPGKLADHDRCPFSLVVAVAVLPGAQTIAPPTYTVLVASRPTLARLFVEVGPRRLHAPPTGPPFLV